MFKNGTISIAKQLSGFQDQYVLDVDLTYKIRVYAFEGEESKRIKEALREAMISDLEIDQEKLDLVSDIPIRDLRNIKQRYRTGYLYDSFGRVLFSQTKRDCND